MSSSLASAIRCWYYPRWCRHGFKGIGTEPAYLINVPTEPYDYQELDEFRIPPHDPSIPYNWALKEGFTKKRLNKWIYTNGSKAISCTRITDGGNPIAVSRGGKR